MTGVEDAQPHHLEAVCKGMSVATLLGDVKPPSFPTIPLIQLAISFALLVAATINIVLHLNSL